MILAMTPGEWWDCGLTFLAGVFLTLYGYRALSAAPGVDPKADEFHRRWGRLFRVAGPIIAVGGILMIAVRLADGR